MHLELQLPLPIVVTAIVIVEPVVVVVVCSGGRWWWVMAKWMSVNRNIPITCLPEAHVLHHKSAGWIAFTQQAQTIPAAIPIFPIPSTLLPTSRFLPLTLLFSSSTSNFNRFIQSQTPPHSFPSRVLLAWDAAYIHQARVAWHLDHILSRLQGEL